MRLTSCHCSTPPVYISRAYGFVKADPLKIKRDLSQTGKTPDPFPRRKRIRGRGNGRVAACSGNACQAIPEWEPTMTMMTRMTGLHHALLTTWGIVLWRQRQDSNAISLLADRQANLLGPDQYDLCQLVPANVAKPLSHSDTSLRALPHVG